MVKVRHDNHTKCPKDPPMGISDEKGRTGNIHKVWQSRRNTISWSSAPAETLRDAIAKITDNGVSVLFTLNPDRTSLIMKTYAGDTVTKEWCDNAADIHAFLDYFVNLHV